MHLSKLNLVVITALTFVCCGCGNEVDTISHATVKKKVVLPPKGDTYEVIGCVKGLQKFVVKYDDNFYRGGMPTHENGIKELSKLGIQTIISITPTEDLMRWSAKYGIEVVELVFEKKNGLNHELIVKYLDVLKNKKGKFYTHCHGGTHRASACAMTYRIYLQNWSYDKALKEYDALGGDPAKERILVTSVKSYKAEK